MGACVVAFRLEEMRISKIRIPHERLLSLRCNIPHCGDRCCRRRARPDTYHLEAGDGLLCVLVGSLVQGGDFHCSHGQTCVLPQRLQKVGLPKQRYDLYLVNPAAPGTWSRLVLNPDAGLPKDAGGRAGAGRRDETFPKHVAWVVWQLSSVPGDELVQSPSDKAWIQCPRSVRPSWDRGDWFDATEHPTVACGHGLLYSLDTATGRLLVHNLGTGATDVFAAPVPSLHPHSTVHLLEHNCSVYLVCLSGAVAYTSPECRYYIRRATRRSSGKGGSSSLGTWEWAPVASMPWTIVNQLRRLGLARADLLRTCCVAADCIFLIFHKPTCLVKFVSYHLSTRTWQFCFEDQDLVPLSSFQGFFAYRPDVWLLQGTVSGSNPGASWSCHTGSFGSCWTEQNHCPCGLPNNHERVAP